MGYGGVPEEFSPASDLWLGPARRRSRRGHRASPPGMYELLLRRAGASLWELVLAPSRRRRCGGIRPSDTAPESALWRVEWILRTVARAKVGSLLHQRYLR